MISRKIQLQFLLILLAGALIISFFILNPFLAPFALAVIFASVLYPLYRKILKGVGNRHSIAALLTVFVTTIFILGPLAFLGAQIFNEAAQLYTSLTQGTSTQNVLITAIEGAGKAFENVVPGTGNFFTNLSTNVDMYIRQSLMWFVNHVGIALSGVSSLVLSLFIFFISLYYLLLDGPRLRQAIMKLSPLDDANDTIIFERLGSAINSVVKGSLLIALLQGALTAIGFSIFGVPNAVLWGTITVIAALIPGIGTSLVILPGVLYLFIVGDSASAIGLLLWGLVAVGLVDNMLYPKLVGNNLQVHPLLVLLSVLGGIAFFGPIGIFLGPITISLLFALISIYSYFVNNEPIKV